MNRVGCAIVKQLERVAAFAHSKSATPKMFEGKPAQEAFDQVKRLRGELWNARLAAAPLRVQALKSETALVMEQVQNFSKQSDETKRLIIFRGVELGALFLIGHAYGSGKI